MEPLLIAGRWQPSQAPIASFRAENPSTGEAIGPEFPISGAADVELALASAAEIAPQLADTDPERIGEFLDAFAEGIEAAADAVCALANEETALGVKPRLRDVELPRTVNQLKLAAAAARSCAWTQPVIDTKAGLRTRFAPLAKPVAVFGPNNFPLAFNAVSGGDFAAAIAARNPVIAKAHPAHPQTCRALAEIAHAALGKAGLPAATVQLIYHMPSELGSKLVSDRRLGAAAFTGSRAGGLALKEAADKAGVPFYAEMSSINPVFVLPGALAERGDEIAQEFAASGLAGGGQFCTNPGVVMVPQGDVGDTFVETARLAFAAVPAPVLLAHGVLDHLQSSIAVLRRAGAEVLCGGSRGVEAGYRFRPTLLVTDAARFVAHAAALQQEAFGPVSLIVRVDGATAMESVAQVFEGNLTGTIYSARDGSDDAAARRIAHALRSRVGRLLNDKMPTGVAVSAAMNHGGPYPATGHPGYTSVGLPASIRRFTVLECYDHVREDRLPAELRDRNPDGHLQRCIDGVWTTADIAGAA
jgi:NADP-dependent aldehyde dehydrogenase